MASKCTDSVYRGLSSSDESEDIKTFLAALQSEDQVLGHTSTMRFKSIYIL